MMTADNILDLEDLARRYDAQVLREYLLEQEDPRQPSPPAVREGRHGEAPASEDGPGPARAGGPWAAEVHDLRPRCFRRLRLLLTVNFATYWAALVYCGYAVHLRVLADGTRALPSLDVSLLGVLMLGTQGTLEFAASACLTRPVRATDARSSGFRAWDGAAWLTGLGARAAVLLDAQCLPLMRKGSALLFLLSAATFAFAIGVFVLGVQLRLLCGLYCSRDQFSYDKPDLFFKGRDAHGMLEGAPIAARPPPNNGEEEELDGMRTDWAPPVSAIKVANCAHFSDLSMLHAVLARLYIPLSCQETQEFIVSASSFSRCFCEDVVQCTVKFFFLMDCELNPLVLTSLVVSATQAIASCFYSSTSAMDLRSSEEHD